MKLVDYAPSASPSLEQQRDALRKGLGRTVQWAMAGRLDGEKKRRRKERHAPNG